MPDDHTRADPDPAPQNKGQNKGQTTEPGTGPGTERDATQNTPQDGTQAKHRPEAALRLQVIRQHDSLDRQATRLAQHTTQIAALAAALRNKEARIDALTQDSHALRQEVADLRGSTSWRITAPLRVLMRAMRRVGQWLGGRG